MAGCCVFCLLTTIGLCTIHESPDWLLGHHYWDDAKLAMKYYDPDVQNENNNKYDDLVNQAYKEHKADGQNALTQSER